MIFFFEDSGGSLVYIINSNDVPSSGQYSHLMNGGENPGHSPFSFFFRFDAIDNGNGVCFATSSSS